MKFSILLIYFFTIISCNFPKNEADAKAYADSVAAANATLMKKNMENPGTDNPDMDGYEKTITCDELENITTIMQEVHKNDSYGFIRFDSTQTLVLHGHFVSADSISTLVLVGADSGPPCGTACNMLLIYNCDSIAHLVYSGNSAWFSGNDVKDLNNDGVVEIVKVSDWMNMGECAQYHQVVNYKGGKENLLYEGSGFDYFGCGYGDMNVSFYHKGDTVGLNLKTETEDADADGVYDVKESRDYKIFKGGKTEDEVIAKLTHQHDSVVVLLKK